MKLTPVKYAVLLFLALPGASYGSEDTDTYLDEILKANNVYSQVQKKVGDWQSRASVTNIFTVEKLKEEAKNKNIKLPEQFWEEQKTIFKEFKSKMKNIVPSVNEVLSFWKTKLKSELTNSEIKEIHLFLKSKVGTKYTSAILRTNEKFGMEINDKYLFKIEMTVHEFSKNIHELGIKYGLGK